ncbi:MULTISPECIES: cytochrome c oxidase subunit 3 [unclassified Pseudomonas]|uniref:cytochrome c oxidase subunit 3 n=1 Tax=unclassified Pseudomonas TaxID=196821 RepID=UPI0013747D1E|nr:MULTISPECIES: cytochrome c oxidase subunit 3 [unclassified Pseudomonas]
MTKWQEITAASPERMKVGKSAPGTEGIWIFVLMDMGIFLLVFLAFMTERRANLEQYIAGQQQLNPLFGLVNTLILLLSSWLVFEAVCSARQALSVRAARQLGFAITLGGVFCLSKLLEYYQELSVAIDINNSFIAFYFFITMVHLLHVLAGLLFLNGYRRAFQENNQPAVHLSGVENAGLFWHFIDVLWIFIFPLLYLV